MLSSDTVSLTTGAPAPSANYETATNAYTYSFNLVLRTPGVSQALFNEQYNDSDSNFYQKLYTALSNLSISGMDLKLDLDKVASGEWNMQKY